jgi:hypothetical protein
MKFKVGDLVKLKSEEENSVYYLNNNISSKTVLKILKSFESGEYKYDTNWYEATISNRKFGKLLRVFEGEIKLADHSVKCRKNK